MGHVKLIVVLAMLNFISACGQTGPLYMPEPEQQNEGEKAPQEPSEQEQQQEQ